VGIPFSEYLNADDIAAGLNPAAPETVAIEAGRIFIDRVHAKVAERADFAVETTLAGRSYLGMIREWKKVGYEVGLIFSSITSSRYIHRSGRPESQSRRSQHPRRCDPDAIHSGPEELPRSFSV